MHVRRVVAIVAGSMLLAACQGLTVLGGPSAGTYPEACAEWNLPERQCTAIVNWARGEAGVDETRIARIHLLPFEREMTMGAGQIALVGFELADGGVVEQAVWCGGIALGPVCNPDPTVRWSTGVDRDVPCTGEAPAGCATLPPTPPPAAVADGRALEVDALDIAIDRLGPYDVRVGTALLPNGYLSERSFELVDDSPDDYWFDHLTLAIESDVPGRDPAGSIYRDPYDGPEPVTVFVRFEVSEFRRPSVIRLRDIVVR